MMEPPAGLPKSCSVRGCTGSMVKAAWSSRHEAWLSSCDGYFNLTVSGRPRGSHHHCVYVDDRWQSTTKLKFFLEQKRAALKLPELDVKDDSSNMVPPPASEEVPEKEISKTVPAADIVSNAKQEGPSTENKPSCTSEASDKAVPHQVIATPTKTCRKRPLSLPESTEKTSPPGSLSPETFHRLTRLKAQLGSQQGNPGRIEHSKALDCCFCKRAKHSCAWQYRVTDVKPQKTVVTGSQCYCCVRACLKLGCGRNIRACSNTPGLLAKIQAKSAEIAESLHGSGGDVCKCHSCTGPKTRLNKKTQVPV
ncbi:unnamed protein product [Durusdinium trenchii]|uniref:Uncharacterized protein n=1 Tax=Durusdinium trenchii TaxID=1381693 RepID=A0ABP0Q1S6_9DINO